MWNLSPFFFSFSRIVQSMPPFTRCVLIWFTTKAAKILPNRQILIFFSHCSIYNVVKLFSCCCNQRLRFGVLTASSVCIKVTGDKSHFTMDERLRYYWCLGWTEFNHVHTTIVAGIWNCNFSYDDREVGPTKMALHQMDNLCASKDWSKAKFYFSLFAVACVWIRYQTTVVPQMKY